MNISHFKQGQSFTEENLTRFSHLPATEKEVLKSTPLSLEVVSLLSAPKNYDEMLCLC